jgi:CBS-domain-containing membrane protein
MVIFRSPEVKNIETTGVIPVLRNDIMGMPNKTTQNGLSGILRATDPVTIRTKTKFQEIFDNARTRLHEIAIDGQAGKANLTWLRGAAVGMVASTVAGIFMIDSLPTYGTVPFTDTLKSALVGFTVIGGFIGAFTLRRPRDMIGTAISAAAGGILTYFFFGPKMAELYAPMIAFVGMVITNCTGHRGSKSSD